MGRGSASEAGAGEEMRGGWQCTPWLGNQAGQSGEPRRMHRALPRRIGRSSHRALPYMVHTLSVMPTSSGWPEVAPEWPVMRHAVKASV